MGNAVETGSRTAVPAFPQSVSFKLTAGMTVTTGENTIPLCMLGDLCVRPSFPGRRAPVQDFFG